MFHSDMAPVSESQAPGTGHFGSWEVWWLRARTLESENTSFHLDQLASRAIPSPFSLVTFNSDVRME